MPIEPMVTIHWSALCTYETEVPLAEWQRVLRGAPDDSDDSDSDDSDSDDSDAADVFATGSTDGAVDEWLAERIETDFVAVQEREITDIQVAWCSAPKSGMDPDDRSGQAHDSATGRLAVLDRKCATCIFRPNNPMHLASGQRDALVAAALARESWIVCHSTLPDYGHPIGDQAVCRGFWDLHAADSLACRLTNAAGGPVLTPPPTDDEPAPDDTTSTPATQNGTNL